MSSRFPFWGHRASLVALVLLSVAGVSIALADDASDPPGRVARLSFADGAVSLQPAGVEDWTNATLNRPLTTGDKVWADQNSRAELDIGSAVIRLGSMTGVSFLNLDDQSAQVNVTAGTAIVHVRDFGGGQAFEVDTPNVAVSLQNPGDYRVEVNEAGDTTVVKVSNGDAEVSATGQTVQMHTQQAFAFNGTDQVHVDRVSVGAPDALDSWSIERDHRDEVAQQQSNEYVPPDMAGADDLANYGTWESTPDYGPVWTPTQVVAGWSPYQYGRWVWVSPWGWTWVDDAPWGFAPFHYGRWAYVGTRWCWVPGPRRVRPVYAPALVAWVGTPGAIAVGGVVGWFPLGPREVYVPSYRVSRTYVQNVNITNTTIVNNTYITNVYENKITNVTYANRNRPGAVVAVSQDVFTSARPISGHTMRVPPNQLSSFTAHGAGPAIAPVRESVLARRPDVSVRRPPPAFVNRPVVARTAPPPAPIPFERQQAAIRANGGRPLERAQMSALQPAAASNPRVRVVGPGPVRPIVNGGSVGSMQDRERALHATPISPTAPQNTFHTDRPPSGDMRQNDQYRMQNTDESRRQAQDVRPTPEARPVPQARPLPQARPIDRPPPTDAQREVDQQRAMDQRRAAADQQRAAEQQRAMEQQRNLEQQRAEQQRAMDQQRALQQQRAIEQQQRTAEQQQRTVPQARPIEQPRPEGRPTEAQRQAPPQRQSSPPQQQQPQNRGRTPEKNDPR